VQGDMARSRREVYRGLRISVKTDDGCWGFWAFDSLWVTGYG